MLGLIALALLILACSYWKLNSFLSESQSDAEAARTAESDAKPAAQQSAPPVILQQLFTVIMAGEQKPTFLATPSCSRSGSFDCVKGEEKAVQMVGVEARDGAVPDSIDPGEEPDIESGQVQ